MPGRSACVARRTTGTVWESGGITRVPSEVDHDLDRLALVHRAVAVGHAVEVGDAVEHAPRLYPAFEHVGQKLLDVRADGGRAARDDDVVEERRLRRRNLLVLRDADASDRAARPRDAQCRDRRLLIADALQDGVRAEAARQLAHALYARVAALADNVRRAE